MQILILTLRGAPTTLRGESENMRCVTAHVRTTYVAVWLQNIRVRPVVIMPLPQARSFFAPNTHEKMLPDEHLSLGLWCFFADRHD